MDAEQARFYERIGGGPALRTAVGEYYELVLADPELAPYFAGVDVGLVKKHQAALLSALLGGPPDYEGRDMIDAHMGLAVSERHFLLMCDHLLAVLRNMQVDGDIIEAISSAVLSLKTSIVY